MLPLLRRLRLDDGLAVLFTTALLAVTLHYDPQFDTTDLRGVLFLFGWYGGFFALARWLRSAPRISETFRTAFAVWVVCLISGLIYLLPGRDMMMLEKPRYLAVALLPFLVGWWVGGESGRKLSGLQVLRDLTPAVVSQLCYLLLHNVIHRINPIDRDQWLLDADVFLFGGHLTQWLEPYVHIQWTEWFSATYSLFLVLPLTLALLLIAKGERQGLLHLLQGLVLCNYLGYIGYLLVPAIGPMYTLTYDVPLSGGWFYQIKESLDSLARVPRDCFPSLHTSNTWLVLLVAFRYTRGFRWGLLPVASSCILATVYLRYHYTIDVVVGLAMGSAVFWGVPKLARWWDQRVGGAALHQDG